MLSNWLTWRRVAVQLDASLRGARIAEVFTQQKNELVLALEAAPGDVHVQLSVQPGFTWLLPKPEFARARKNSLDLFPALPGDVILDTAIAVNDRVLRLRLKSGRTLYATLFPARGNLLLHDVDGTLIERFKQGRPPVDTPALMYDNALQLPDAYEIVHAFSTAGEMHALDALKSLRPWLQGTIAHELLHRAEIPEATDVRACSKDAVQCLAEVMTAVRGDLESGPAWVYMSGELPQYFSLIPLRHIEGAEPRRFDNPVEAMFFFVRKHWATRDFVAVRDRMIRATTKELEKTEKKIAELSSTAELKRMAEHWRKLGNLLMIHMLEQPSQPNCMIVPDIFTDPRLVVSIPLTPGQSVLENAQRFFGKAQRTTASVAYVEERRAMLLRLREALREMLAHSDTAASAQELREAVKSHSTLLRRLGLTEQGIRDESPFPFRRFVVFGGFEVWVGRNSENNDELTVRHARPNDIWFHARGVGGSHTVLRVGSAPGDPPKEAIRQAASIAAYYSKHRNAKNVPVAYTEKKYVRKPKGVPAGTVIMEKEKVIMVQPMLPEGGGED